MNASDLIRRHEGEILVPYCDECGAVIVRMLFGWGCTCTTNRRAQGNITIGVGRNLSGQGITRQESGALLENDELEARGHLLNWPKFYDLNEVRQAALIDLCFNLGAEGFDKFVLVKAALEFGLWDAAARQMRESLAYQQEPRRIGELAEMIEFGEWPKGDY